MKWFMGALPVLLVACVGHGGEAIAVSEQPLPRPARDPTVPDATQGVERPRQDATQALSADDLVVQLEYAPGFAGVDTRDPFDAYGRVPTFSMYRDGSVIYVGENEHGEHGLFVAQRGEMAVTETLQHILALGFEDIEGHEETCIERPTGRLCASDSATLVLRVRVGETMREIRNYAGWAKAHGAQLAAIYDRIELLGQPSPWGTRPFVPLAATLYTRTLRPSAEAAECDRVGIEPWRLDASMFEHAFAANRTTSAVRGEPLRRLTAVLGNGVGRYACFGLGDRTLRAELVPWLPGVDHHEAIAAAARPDEEPLGAW
ncbi:MAG: hypothetical protein AAF721_34675 [Myxococcota bacterium]